MTATSLDLIAASDDENAVKTYVSQIGIASSVISSDKKKAEVKANVGMIFIPFTITGANANTDELKLDGSVTPSLAVTASGGGTKLQFFGVSTEDVAASDLNGTLKNGFILNAKDVEDKNLCRPDDQGVHGFSTWHYSRRSSLHDPCRYLFRHFLSERTGTDKCDYNLRR